MPHCSALCSGSGPRPQWEQGRWPDREMTCEAPSMNPKAEGAAYSPGSPRPTYKCPHFTCGTASDLCCDVCLGPSGLVVAARIPRPPPGPSRGLVGHWPRDSWECGGERSGGVCSGVLHSSSGKTCPLFKKAASDPPGRGHPNLLAPPLPPGPRLAQGLGQMGGADVCWISGQMLTPAGP